MQWRPSDFIINSTIIRFMLRVSPMYSTHTTNTHTRIHADVHTLIAGNCRMVQIFAYFEHVRSVRKLEPTKIFAEPHVHTVSNGFLPVSEASTVLQMSL